MLFWRLLAPRAGFEATAPTKNPHPHLRPTCVAVGILPAVEPGAPPCGQTVVSKGLLDGLASSPRVPLFPGGRMPPATAGEPPATTHQGLVGALSSGALAFHNEDPIGLLNRAPIPSRNPQLFHGQTLA